MTTIMKGPQSALTEAIRSYPALVADGAAENERSKRLFMLLQQAKIASGVAAPLTAVAMAVSLEGGQLEWQSDESLTAAARRIVYDTAWQAFENQSFDVVDSLTLPVAPRSLYQAALRRIGMVDAPAPDVAEVFLARRGQVDDWLNAAEIRWGGDWMGTREVAEHVRVAQGNWRAKLSRKNAPAPDRPGEIPFWRLTTIEAWYVRTRRGAVRWAVPPSVEP